MAAARLQMHTSPNDISSAYARHAVSVSTGIGRMALIIAKDDEERTSVASRPMKTEAPRQFDCAPGFVVVVL